MGWVFGEDHVFFFYFFVERFLGDFGEILEMVFGRLMGAFSLGLTWVCWWYDEVRYALLVQVHRFDGFIVSPVG